MRLPQVAGKEGEIDLKATKEMVDAFMAAGFTYFDTAACYHQGKSEGALYETLVKRYPRTAYTITDKLSLFMLSKAEEMPDFFAGQLRRLGVDYVDCYLLHALGKESYAKAERFDAFAFVQKLKAEGKVKHIGMSYHDSAALLDEILTAHPEMEYVQLQLNYLDWEDVTVESEKCYEVCRKHGKPVIVMEPIKGGSLVNIPEEAVDLYKEVNPDASVASWAIRFAASPEGVVMVLSGMSNLEQMRDNLSYMTDFQPLSRAEYERIEKATDIIKASLAIPCTACRYCVDDCPKKIAIPDYFAVYNNLKRFGSKQAFVAATYYDNLAQTHGKASECIGCGKCESLCPQHLTIKKYLQEIASTLEK